jgi:4-alpha-glucanotransferase
MASAESVSPASPWQDRDYGATIAEALRELGIARLVLTVHDASFPAGDDDLGRGTPASQAARELLAMVRQLGFTGIQLGPQGRTTPANASPYDSTLFSRDPLAIALGPLLDGSELAELRADLPASAPWRAQHALAWAKQQRALAALYHRQRHARAGEVAAFQRAAGEWLERDALFAALTAEHGSDDPRRWPALDRALFSPPPDRQAAASARRQALAAAHGDTIDFYAYCQLLAHEQHRAFQAEAAQLGLRLYGDLQIGFSHQDAWAYRALFLPDYLLGAPPSRTNPDGQPWGYPVLDPAQYGDGAGALVAARLRKLLDEFDGLRIDHPHGLVDPWVYRADDPDPLHAVQSGARLFSSPDLPDHPALARFAIARADELDRGTRRWADHWVRAADPAEVARYARLFDLVLDGVRAHGRDSHEIICEVLSTWPYPLRRVMERDRLGRFVVTQKANLADPADVYRSENAQPNDWIMVGNHDTAPLWLLVDGWMKTGQASARARHLAERLEPDAAARPAFAAAISRSPEALATALFAELFIGPAKNVSLFFADLFGLKEIYNQPGTVSDDNWSLRVPPDYRAHYAAGLRQERVLNLPRVLLLALRAAPGTSERRAALLARLRRWA